MNNQTAGLGVNRTGMGVAPLLGREMIQNATDVMPSALGDARSIAVVRQSYAREADPLGAVPPPATLKGAAGAAVEALKGDKPMVLLDRLGERLAFERSGVRLWTAVLSKFDAYGTWAGGPQREEIESIVSDEQAHFAMLHGAITGLGADPTVMSPSADLAGVEAQGLVQVLTDPRANLAQSLHAILVAELVDNDAWVSLIDLARLSHEPLAVSFGEARAAEGRHLMLVRQWLSEHCRLEARGELSDAES